MIEIKGRTYPEIRADFLLKKTEYDVLRKKRADLRGELSEQERELLDKRLLVTFNEIVQEKSTDLELLSQLVNEGAQTTYFKEYELSGGDNFAQALKEWLRAVSFSNEHSAIAKALDLCLEAGDAFLSNKYYVGNGGALSIYLLFELAAGKWVYVSRPAKETSSNDTFVLHLFLKMALLAEDHTKFWKEFYLGLQLLLDNIKGEATKLQHNMARFGLQCLVYERPTFLQEYFSHDLDYNPELVDMCQVCFSSPAFLDELLKYAESGIGIFGDHSIKAEMNKVLAVKWPKIYGVFLRSNASRKKIADLLKSSVWLRRQFLSHPESLFRLVKEKAIMLPLLKKERSQLLALRNEQGDNLLIALCKAQGKNENMVELYLKYGFDPFDTNTQGESAVTIAKKRGKDQILSVLTSRTGI